MKKAWKIFAFGTGFIVFILTAVSIIAANASPEESKFPTHSTFFTDRFGTHAFFRLLESLGYETEKNYLSLNDVEDYGFNNYLFMGPDDYFEGAERDSLRSYLEQGSYAICIPQRTQNFLSELGIELNTSGLNRPVSEIYPSPLILSLAFERGIPICFGSDAHGPEQVGNNFDQALRFANEAGYTHFFKISQRKKELLPLPETLLPLS